MPSHSKRSMASSKATAQKTTLEAIPVTATATPSLPPAPQGDWWDDTQWAVLWSLLDAALAPVVASDAADGPPPNPEDRAGPGLSAYDCATVHKISQSDLDATVARVCAAMANPPDAALLAAYLADRPSDHPAFVTGVLRTVSNLSPATVKQLGGLLKALSGPVGAFLLTGSRTPVHQQPIHVREATLRGWTRAWTPALRMAARSIRTIAQTRWVIDTPLFRQAAGYANAPPPIKRAEKQEQPYNFTFMQFGAVEDTLPAVIETDVVIVGSGCGGAVCAQVLAAAGHRVVVVEKGYHVPQAQLPLPQAEGMAMLYENGGLLASEDPRVCVLAGACWGGGGTINWSVSLRTPDEVRQEWANPPGDESGDDNGGVNSADMSFVTSPAFDASLDRVCAFMGVYDKEPTAAVTDPKDDPDKHSHRARVLLDGAAKLRFEAAPLLQNTRGGQPHDDGYCHLGCGTGAKRGTVVSWLPAAATAGARFIEGFHVERVLFDGDDGVQTTTPTTLGSSEEPRAVGVVGTWTSRDAAGGVAAAGEQQTRRVVVRAKKVIVSCGSLWSPLVLMKSGLTNPQIGKNLHIHPCYTVGAFFDEETKPMDKGIITGICTSFVDLDGQFHGPRLESTCMVPYTILSNMPAAGSLDFKLAALRYRHLDGFIALVRDRDPGHVAPDPATGQPVVHYALSSLDREHAVEGAVGLARLCHAAGANEIRPYIGGVEPWRRAASSAAADDAFEKWTDDVRRAGLSASPLWGGWSAASPVASAHQMGTCRMGADGGRRSVVDPHGRVWGTRGLYVADASVFPSASGVNPMVTVMALADWIAQGISAELHSEAGGAVRK